MIRSITYPGGFHGEFVITQIQKNYPNQFYTNYYCPDIPFANRYQVYQNPRDLYKALECKWTVEDVKKFLNENKSAEQQNIILRRHSKIETPFPNINIYPDNAYYFVRGYLLASLKLKLTDNKVFGTFDESDYEDYLLKNNFDEEKDLGISSFFDLSGLHKLEKFFNIKYTDKMKNEINRYCNRDDKLLERYIGNWEKMKSRQLFEKIKGINID